MTSGVTWQGLDELGVLLRSLPQAVQREAAAVVKDAAQTQYASMVASFPANGKDVTGNLRRGTAIEQTGPLTWYVRNRAPHSHLYERDFYHVAAGKTVQGKNVWVRRAQDVRERMLRDLRRVVDLVASRTGLLRVS